MEGALAIFRWKMLPPLFLRDPFCVFAKRKPQNWWPEVDPVSSCQHQSNDQQRYINSLRKVSSLSKAAKCLLFCLLRNFYPFKSCSTLATPNSSPLLLEGGKVLEVVAMGYAGGHAPTLHVYEVVGGLD